MSSFVTGRTRWLMIWLVNNKRNALLCRFIEIIQGEGRRDEISYFIASITHNSITQSKVGSHRQNLFFLTVIFFLMRVCEKLLNYKTIFFYPPPAYIKFKIRTESWSSVLCSSSPIITIFGAIFGLKILGHQSKESGPWGRSSIFLGQRKLLDLHLEVFLFQLACWLEEKY